MLPMHFQPLLGNKIKLLLSIGTMATLNTLLAFDNNQQINFKFTCKYCKKLPVMVDCHMDYQYWLGLQPDTSYVMLDINCSQHG